MLASIATPLRSNAPGACPQPGWEGTRPTMRLSQPTLSARMSRRMPVDWLAAAIAAGTSGFPCTLEVGPGHVNLEQKCKGSTRPSPASFQAPDLANRSSGSLRASEVRM
jgi:hypothetical protein